MIAIKCRELGRTRAERYMVNYKLVRQADRSNESEAYVSLHYTPLFNPVDPVPGFVVSAKVRTISNLGDAGVRRQVKDNVKKRTCVYISKSALKNPLPVPALSKTRNCGLAAAVYCGCRDSHRSPLPLLCCQDGEALGPVVILTMKKAQGEWRVAKGEF